MEAILCMLFVLALKIQGTMASYCYYSYYYSYYYCSGSSYYSGYYDSFTMIPAIIGGVFGGIFLIVVICVIVCVCVAVKAGKKRTMTTGRVVPGQGPNVTILSNNQNSGFTSNQQPSGFGAPPPAYNQYSGFSYGPSSNMQPPPSYNSSPAYPPTSYPPTM